MPRREHFQWIGSMYISRTTPTPEPTPAPADSPTPTEAAPTSLPSNVAACLGSGICQLVNRVIYQRAFAPIVPEYILHLRPELCLDADINDIANEI
jgi:hypothetical protein